MLTLVYHHARLQLGAAVAFCLLANRLSAAPPIVEMPNSTAATAAEMKPYTDVIGGTDVKFEMLPIPGGKFTMGSPESEHGHKPDEGPQHEVKIEPFWLEKYELTWDEFEVFMFTLDIDRRKITSQPSTDNDKLADALARPTKPYTDMSFGMGKDGFPAISMTHYAARMYCRWLSAKTGRYYRLPTEAEWEYACRAGTTTAYSFGDDAKQLNDYAWHDGNSEDSYHKIGKKKPNTWGLYDMHGNVAEWVLDQYIADYYAQFKGKTAIEPLAVTQSKFPHPVRGGSWQDDAVDLRSAARKPSKKEWEATDPQLPQSVWYLTDAEFVGFRICRPLHEPTAEEKQKIWDAGLEAEGEGGRIIWPNGEPPKK
ncbi:MAG TPA: formylglycine-generating enzyme family protein [Pirellulales bacterium]|nr:formylglycine-generating enzyme family protein [Pirellulales bacterium]